MQIVAGKTLPLRHNPSALEGTETLPFFVKPLSDITIT